MEKVELYRTKSGGCPYEDWLDGLEIGTQARISTFVDRVAHGGSKSNVKALKDGVFEIKINVGPGYRVYFGKKGRKVVLLLLGGDKSSQKNDVRKAKEYWAEYNSSQ